MVLAGKKMVRGKLAMAAAGQTRYPQRGNVRWGRAGRRRVSAARRWAGPLIAAAVQSGEPAQLARMPDARWRMEESRDGQRLESVISPGVQIHLEVAARIRLVCAVVDAQLHHLRKRWKQIF